MHMKRSLKVIVSIGIALLTMFMLSGCSTNKEAKAVIGCPRDDTSVEIMVVDKYDSPKEYIPKQDPAVVVKGVFHRGGQYHSASTDSGESSLVYTAPDKSALPEHDGDYRLRITCKGKRSNWVGSKFNDNVNTQRNNANTQRNFVSNQTDKADSFLFDKNSSALKAVPTKARAGIGDIYYIRCYSPEDSKEILKEHTAEADIVCEAVGYANP